LVSDGVSLQDEPTQNFRRRYRLADCPRDVRSGSW